MNSSELKSRQVDELIWREDLYPRFEPDSTTIQQYAADLEMMPPIEVNQHNEIIDGYHRWTAARKNQASTIAVIVTTTSSDIDFLALACDRNAKHGLGLTAQEKKTVALRLYADGTGKTESEIATLLSIKIATATGYLARHKKDLKHERNSRIWNAWLACDTLDEIAEREPDLNSREAVALVIENVKKSDAIQKLDILSQYQEPDWTPPLYSTWKQQTKTNATSHFGNTEAAFTDRLLYLYTEPFDIVVDPFAGGGSTIDVCKRRLRRYWVSDRLPIVERRDIRQADIFDGPPMLHKRWSDVTLLYLDPPYWRQAAGEYSDDPEDLANMNLADFYSCLCNFVTDCGRKMRTGSHVAMMMQPTQWRNEGRRVEDHNQKIISLVDLPLQYLRTFACPYESQQYNAQQVEWAKDNRECLENGRGLIIWEVL